MEKVLFYALEIYRVHNDEYHQSGFPKFDKHKKVTNRFLRGDYLGLDIIYRNREVVGKEQVKLFYNNLKESLKNSEKGKAIGIYVKEELAEIGKPFIDFESKQINGENFKLSSLKGNYILLSFVSAGCYYSRQQNRYLSKNYDEFTNKGISIVNFSIDKSKDAWLESSLKDNIIWTNISDLEGIGSKTKNLYNIQGVPHSFLIDRDGNIIEIISGYPSNLLSHLEKFLK